MSETDDHLKKFLNRIDRSWANGYRTAELGSPQVKADFILTQVEDLFKKIEVINTSYAHKIMEELPFGYLTDPNFIVKNEAASPYDAHSDKITRLPKLKEETKEALRSMLKTIATSSKPWGNPALSEPLDTLQSLCQTIKQAYPPENAHYGDDHPSNGSKARQAAAIWDQLVNIRNATVVFGLCADAPLRSRQEKGCGTGLGA